MASRTLGATVILIVALVTALDFLLALLTLGSQMIVELGCIGAAVTHISTSRDVALYRV